MVHSYIQNSRKSDLTYSRSTNREETFVELIAIGASSHGPQSVIEVLSNLPDDFSIPIVVCQHMPAAVTDLLIHRLRSILRRPIVEAFEGARFKPGDIWIAPGNYHITVGVDRIGEVVHIDHGKRENGCRPSIDLLFQSVADTYGNHAVGVLLSQENGDGARGSQAILKSKGQILHFGASITRNSSISNNHVDSEVAHETFSAREIGQRLTQLARPLFSRPQGPHWSHHFSVGNQLRTRIDR